jgi:HEAT repeat protein
MADLVPRLDAVWCLRFIGDPRAVPVLSAIVADPAEDDKLRCSAAGALGDIGSDEAIPALRLVADTWVPLPETDAYTYDVARDALKAIEKIERGERTPHRRRPSALRPWVVEWLEAHK